MLHPTYFHACHMGTMVVLYSVRGPGALIIVTVPSSYNHLKELALCSRDAQHWAFAVQGPHNRKASQQADAVMLTARHCCPPLSAVIREFNSTRTPSGTLATCHQLLWQAELCMTVSMRCSSWTSCCSSTYTSQSTQLHLPCLAQVPGGSQASEHSAAFVATTQAVTWSAQCSLPVINHVLHYDAHAGLLLFDSLCVPLQPLSFGLLLYCNIVVVQRQLCW